MYLSRLTLTPSRVALNWLSNPYRVHQRLMMACGSDPRMLFRIEEDDAAPRILVQSWNLPDWPVSFDSFHVLAQPVEVKPFELHLSAGQALRFCLVANPTVKRDGRRLGLLGETEQQAWLERKLSGSGAEMAACRATSLGLTHSRKKADDSEPVHLMVRFEGLLHVKDPEKLAAAVSAGIGAAKGFGCGLLSLARAG